MTTNARVYRVVRFRFQSTRRPRTIRSGLTLSEAQAWCSRDDTHDTKHSPARWFDGYDYMPGCRPKGGDA